MKVIFFLLFAIISSCSHRELVYKNEIELLNKIKINGEGKCRLTIFEKQDLFSCESFFKDNNWNFLISIPFKGEELIVFPEIDKKNYKFQNIQTHHGMIYQGFSQSSFSQKIEFNELMQKLHFLVRLLNADLLKENIDCHGGTCLFDQKVLNIKHNKGRFIIESESNSHFIISIIAENLTESHFLKTSLIVEDLKNNRFKSKILELEFFWKDS